MKRLYLRYAEKIAMRGLAFNRLNELADLLVDASNDEWYPEERWHQILSGHGQLTEPEIQEICAFVRECQRIPLAGELSSDAAFELSPGTLVDRFTIIEKIDGGGMGVVYKASFEGPGMERRFVALKVGTGHALSMRRLRAERNILSRLNHPGIIQIFDAGSTPSGHPYFAMELLEGALRIDRHCSYATRPLKERVSVFRKLCLVVDFVHRENFAHRDLKPANILVTKEGEPKLLDFGGAVPIERFDEGPTFMNSEVTPRRLGTPGRMSPQHQKGDSPSVSDDIYALGTILHDLIGDAPEPVDDPLRVKCNEVALKCLDKSPRKRFATADEVSKALEQPATDAPTSKSGRTFGEVVTPRRLVVFAVAIALSATGFYFGAPWFEERSKRNQRLAEFAKETRRQEQMMKFEKIDLDALREGLAFDLREATGIKNTSFEELEQRSLEQVQQGNGKIKSTLAQFYIHCRGGALSNLQKLTEPSTPASGAVPSTVLSEADAESRRILEHLLYYDCTRQKVQTGMQWLKEIADAGSPRAAVLVAQMIIAGSGGIDKDPKEAFRWATKAALAQDPDGLYTLGLLYSKGIAVVQDEEAAFNLFERAADLGSIDGQYRTALVYADGASSKRPKDLFRAYVLTLMAAQEEGGFFSGQKDPMGLSKETREKAVKLRELLASVFNAEQRQLATKTAAEVVRQINARRSSAR